jgi:hypothetical protein
MTDTATPSPWLVSYTGDPSHQIETADGYIVAEGIDNPRDAILAAAAPDMFAALEEIAEMTTSNIRDEPHDVQEIARAALNKARGKA